MLTKYCKWCQQEKEIGLFHVHKRMKDGRLNKCGACVVKAVAAWCEKNPDARKIAYAKAREKKGLQTREQYLRKKHECAKGKKASALEYYHRNKDKQREWLKKDRQANPAKYQAKAKRDRLKAIAEKPEQYRALKCRTQSKRRAEQLLRIPAWSDEFITAGMYELCALFRAIGIDMTVDHIVPLQGKKVSGLHVHNNLQLMHREANSAKGNRFQETALDSVTAY